MQAAIPVAYARLSKIFFCGMGGSAINGEILRALFKERSKHIFCMDRVAGRLPRWVDGNTLVVLSSYSGNTEEVLAACRWARQRGGHLLAVTSGGRLAVEMRRYAAPLVLLNGGLPPRSAIGYLTFSLLAVFQRLRLLEVKSREVEETREIVRKPNQAMVNRIARKLHRRFVHLYAVEGAMEVAAVRWRSQLAENAKMLASHHSLPEMLHNEIQGWQYPEAILRQSAAVFLRDRYEEPLLRKKIAFAKKYISRQSACVLEFKARGESSLTRLFSQIVLGDWVSVRLARLEGIEPRPIAVLDAVKNIR